MKKSVFFLLLGALSVVLLCGFGPVPPTGDTRPFGLIIAVVVISGLAVAGIVAYLIIRSRSSGKRSRPK